MPRLNKLDFARLAFQVLDLQPKDWQALVQLRQRVDGEKPTRKRREKTKEEAK